jgi:cell division protein FtsB
MAQADRDQTTAKRRDGAAPPRRSITTVVLLVAALVLVLDGIAGERGWLANRRAQAQYDQAVRALEAAKARNAARRDEVRRLREDPAAIEEAARRQLGLMKPGEKVFILRDHQAAAKER